MLLRYASSVGAGAIVTAALIYWMQLMVGDDGRAIPQATDPFYRPDDRSGRAE